MTHYTRLTGGRPLSLVTKCGRVFVEYPGDTRQQISPRKTGGISFSGIALILLAAHKCAEDWPASHAFVTCAPVNRRQKMRPTNGRPYGLQIVLAPCVKIGPLVQRGLSAKPTGGLLGMGTRCRQSFRRLAAPPPFTQGRLFKVRRLFGGDCMRTGTDPPLRGWLWCK